MPTAICGVLSGGPDAVRTLDAMLGALADFGPERTVWTGDAVRFGCRNAQAGSPGARRRPRRRLGVGGGRVHRRPRGAVRYPRHSAPAAPRPRRRRFGAAGIRALARGVSGASRRRLRLRGLGRAPRHAVLRPRPRRRGPFYYALEDERFVFACAVEAVLAAPGVSASLDEEEVAASLSSVGGTLPRARSTGRYASCRPATPSSSSRRPAGLGAFGCAWSGIGVRRKSRRRGLPRTTPMPSSSSTCTGRRCVTGCAAGP